MRSCPATLATVVRDVAEPTPETRRPTPTVVHVPPLAHALRRQGTEALVLAHVFGDVRRAVTPSVPPP